MSPILSFALGSLLFPKTFKSRVKIAKRPLISKRSVIKGSADSSSNEYDSNRYALSVSNRGNNMDSGEFLESCF